MLVDGKPFFRQSDIHAQTMKSILPITTKLNLEQINQNRFGFGMLSYSIETTIFHSIFHELRIRDVANEDEMRVWIFPRKKSKQINLWKSRAKCGITLNSNEICAPIRRDGTTKICELCLRPRKSTDVAADAPTNKWNIFHKANVSNDDD